MARKLSFVLALAVMAAVALLLNLSSAPQIGVAGVAPDQPHDPSAEVLGGVINTNEDVKTDVPLSANHNDGQLGCEELDFSTSNNANGTVGAITDRACNTTELARDLTDNNEFYNPTASENGAGADTCSDGIDNDTATVPDGLIDADDPDCLFDDAVPVVSIGGLDKVQGVIQIGDELIFFDHADPAGNAHCGGDGSDKGSSPPCLHSSNGGVTRGAFKTTEVTHSTGDTVIFRSELGDAKIEDNLSAGITADDPEKGENLSLNSTAGFPSEGVVLVDDELIIYRGAGVTDVIRGALGTTAAVHTAKAKVFLVEPGFYGTLVEEIDSVQSILRITTLTGYGLNGGIVEVENEVILYDQTGSTSAECEGAAPCLLGLTRAAFGTTSKLHEVGRPVFTAAGDDIDQATANFTPANNFFNDDSSSAATTVIDEDIDADTVGDVDETSTILPIVSATNFNSSGGIITIAKTETASYTSIGTTDAACAPFSAPCLLGVTRGLVGTGAKDLDGGEQVTQLAINAGFFYAVGKDSLDSVSRQVLILVIAVNDPPVLSGGSVILAQGTITGGLKETNPNTTFTITATDVDNSNNELVFTVTSIPSAGTLWAEDNKPSTPVVEDDGFALSSGTGIKAAATCEKNPPETDKVANTCSVIFAYQQDSTFDGSDSFVITVTDGKTGSPDPVKDAKGLDTLTVNITNSTPTAGPVDKVEVPKNGERTILLTGSDADLGHCELNFIVKTHPEHGNLVLQNNNECRPGGPNTDSATMVYVPDQGYNGPDQFTYQVYDRTGKGAYDAVLGDGHNRTSLAVDINVGGGVEGLIWGDVDCDGDVDAADALKIQRWLAGLSVDQEPGCLEIGTEF